MNSTTEAYHVSFNKLLAGDLILPSKTFFNSLSVEKKEIEKKFEENKPSSKPSRNTSIFVFCSIDDAKSHALYTHGNLYKVKMDSIDILHEGDWNWLDKSTQDPTNTNIYADKYWNSKMTDKPKVELIVKKAIVQSEIFSLPLERTLWYEKINGIK